MLLSHNLISLFQKYSSKFNTIFCYENFKQNSASRNRILSFVRHWLSRFKSIKKCTAKPYLFLVINGILASDNSSRFRKNILERIWKLITIIDDKVRDEKV